jgi:L-glyceraldehyde 3-phosphate reductase
MTDSMTVTYVPEPDRYEQMTYRRCGQSGIELPMISLGLWQNFGDDTPISTQRAIIWRAFDLGVTHFDLANNYGGTAPAQALEKGAYGEPYGSAETNFGRILAEDLRPYRDELLVSTKAGWDMWPGPYGDWGHGSTCSRAWISRCAGWAWTTSTSSTATGPTRAPRSRRR